MNNSWKIDFFTGLENAVDMQDVLDITLKTIKPFGFDFCGWRSKLPLSEKKFIVMNDNEDKLSQQRIKGLYDEAPVPKHCSQSTDPISWTGKNDDPLVLQAPELFEEYHGTGHRSGWAQSIVESNHMFSMLYADSLSVLSQEDIDYVNVKMQWVATAALSKMHQFRLQPNIQLTEREKEILKWTGAEKSIAEIGQLLSLSHRTVGFHMYNAMNKLNAPNKMAAVIKAIYLRLLY